MRVTQLCPNCSKVSELGKFCKNCKKGSLSGLIVATYYEEPISQLIHGFKYRFIRELAPVLADLTLPNLEKLKTQYNDFIIVPVPLHRSRYAWRGFNQSEEIGKVLAKKLFVDLKKPLVRIKSTTPQVELKREKRLKNPHGAFRATNSGEVKNKTVLLVDDIATTLATLEECAGVLKAAGAKRVWGLVVARGK